jgi:hypothetical protein
MLGIAWQLPPVVLPAIRLRARLAPLTHSWTAAVLAVVPADRIFSQVGRTVGRWKALAVAVLCHCRHRRDRNTHPVGALLGVKPPWQPMCPSP